MGELMVKSVGVDYWHPPEFAVDRPQGSGDWVFLHFLAPTTVLTLSGEEKVEMDTCIIYSPNQKSWCAGDGGRFGNDWFHFDGASAEKLLADYELPVNRVIRPTHTEFIPTLLSRIHAELHRGEKWGAQAAGLVAEEVLLRLSRALTEKAEALSPRKRELRRTFQWLRQELYREFARYWSISDMADMVHLSANRFSVLYREFFGVPPLEDLLEARMTHARWLLSSTNMQIGEVAAASGIENIYYFSRCFKKREGCTPSEFSRRVPT